MTLRPCVCASNVSSHVAGVLLELVVDVGELLDQDVSISISPLALNSTSTFTIRLGLRSFLRLRETSGFGLGGRFRRSDLARRLAWRRDNEAWRLEGRRRHVFAESGVRGLIAV